VAHVVTILPIIVAVLVLAFPWFLSVALFLENKSWNKYTKWFIHVISLVVVGGYYVFLFPLATKHSLVSIIYYALSMFIVISLCASVLALPNVKNADRFWKHFYRVVMRIFFTGLFTAIAFFGLSATFFSFHYLFAVDSTPPLNQVIVILVGIVGAGYLLAGFPFLSRDEEVVYPAIFRFLIIYIIIPLLTVYGIILYGYLLKIIATRVWPIGGVVGFITGYSLVGLIAFVWSYPLWHTDVRTKTYLFFRMWLITLLPLIILYFVAIGVRIHSYGVTVARYYVGVYGLWLGAIALYFIFSRKKHLAIISVSIAVVVFFSSWGPWSSFAVAERSQINHLQTIFTQNGMFKDGKVQKSSYPLSEKDGAEIFSALSYLESYNALNKLQPWFDEKNLSIETNHYTSLAEAMAQYLDIPASSKGSKGYYNFYSYSGPGLSDLPEINVSGYEWLLPIQLHSFAGPQKIKTFDLVKVPSNKIVKEKIIFELADEPVALRVSVPSVKKNVQFDLQALIKNLILIRDGNAESIVPIVAEDLQLSVNDGPVHLKLQIDEISLHVKSGKYSVDRLVGRVLFKLGK
jgi:hypothetical protein